MKAVHLIPIIAFLLLAIAVPVAAEDTPVLPASFFGTATYSDGTSLPAGSTIFATVDGITSSFTLIEDGKIGASGTFGKKFLVSGDTTGSEIIFSTNNIPAEQKATFEPGSLAEVNLVFKIKKTSIDISPSSEAAVNFKDNPVLITKEGATVPQAIIVDVVVISDKSTLPPAPASTSNVKSFDITVENAESLGGEFAIEIPIAVSDEELKSSFKNNRDAVVVYHSNGQSWDKVPITRIEIKSGYTNFYILATEFSPYMLGVDTSAPPVPTITPTVTPTSKPSSGGSSDGATVIVTATPTATPTAVGTVTIPPTTKPTATTSKSPAPFVGLIAGLGAVALVLARMRR